MAAQGNVSTIKPGDCFGRLVVIRKTTKKSGGHFLWECRCECGKTIKSIGCALTTNNTRSCGCLYRETRKGRLTHGCKNTRTYRIWTGMKRRCSNRRDINYKRYGHKGVSVCERWLKFENFLADMGMVPEGASLDRINNKGNYEPTNCRWASRKEQNRNRSDNRTATVHGETLCLSEWAERLGLTWGEFRKQLYLAMDVDAAVAKVIDSHGLP